MLEALSGTKRGSSTETSLRWDRSSSSGSASERLSPFSKVVPKRKDPSTGVGLACGTEKGSYVAACVEVEIDRERKKIVPRHVSEVFE